MNGRKTECKRLKNFEDTSPDWKTALQNALNFSKLEFVTLDIRVIYFEITSRVSNLSHSTSSLESATVDLASLFLSSQSSSQVPSDFPALIKTLPLHQNPRHTPGVDVLM